MKQTLETNLTKEICGETTHNGEKRTILPNRNGVIKAKYGMCTAKVFRLWSVLLKPSVKNVSRQDERSGWRRKHIYIYIDSKENAPKIYRELEDELFLFFFSESCKCLGEAFPAAIERQHCPKITLLKLQESNGPRVMRDTCMSYAAMLQVHLHLFLTISKDISSNSTVSYQKKHGTQQRIL